MKALKFLVYSNIWISLGAGLLTILSFKITGKIPDFEYAIFVFFSTLFSYNFQRVSRLTNITNHSPDSWVVKNSVIAKAVLIIAFLGALVFVPVFDHPFSLLWLIILGIISFGYSYGKFRDLPYIKIILIAASWGIASGTLPMLIAEPQSYFLYATSFGWVFFYILAITIPFDIRDIGIDEDAKRTIPQWVGIEKAKKIAWISLGVSLFFILISASLITSICMLVSCVIAGYLIYKTSEKRNDLYFSLLIDGHIIFQFLVVYFLC